MHRFFGILAAAAFVVNALPASSATVVKRKGDFCSKAAVCSDDSGRIVLNLDVSEMVGDEIDLKFVAFGDFDRRREAFKISIEGLRLGRFLNGNTNNDLFTSRNGDVGNHYSSVNVAKVTLTRDQLTNQLADGKLRIVFRPVSDKIGDETPDGAREEFVKVKATFDTAADAGDELNNVGLAPVPVPASAGLLALALGGLGALRMRKKADKA